MNEPRKQYDRAFYEGHGWDRLTGDDDPRAQTLLRLLAERRSWLDLAGNLYSPRVIAEFPGSRCLMPVNWLTLPERNFDYCLLRAEPGSSFPIHCHGYADEIYVVISGSGTVFLDGEPHPARQHDVFHFPPGTPHGFDVPKDADQTFDLFIVNAPAVQPDLRSRYFAVEPRQRTMTGAGSPTGDAA